MTMPKETAVALVRTGYEQFTPEQAQRVIDRFETEPDSVLLDGWIHDNATRKS